LIRCNAAVLAVNLIDTMELSEEMTLGAFSLPEGVTMTKSSGSRLAVYGGLAMSILFSQAALAQNQALPQARKANEGEMQRGQVYDGRRSQPTVRANPAPKPSPVGQPIRSTSTQQGYQPAGRPLRTTAPPAPTGTSYNKKK
jgi:hypothetical protein